MDHGSWVIDDGSKFFVAGWTKKMKLKLVLNRI